MYVLSAIGICVALFLALSNSSLEQHKAFANFVIGIDALLIGIMLFVIYRRFPAWRKFVESMTLLILFMTPAGLIVPLLLSYNITIYYFLPAYLACLFGWLLFSQHIIYGKNNWHVDPTKKQTLVPWFILIGLFLVGAIAIVVVAPHVPNWFSQ